MFQGIELALVDAHLLGVLEDATQPREQDEGAVLRHAPEEERHGHFLIQSLFVRVREERRQLIRVDSEGRDRHVRPAILCARTCVREIECQ